jgi:hypothetical protein
VYDGSRQLAFLFGGRADGAPPLLDQWVWDGTSWTAKNSAKEPPANWAAMTAFDTARGVVVYFGGQGNDNGETWEWNGSAWTPRTLSVHPPPRSSGALAFDRARNKTLLFGGLMQQAELNDTWEYDGTIWKALAPPTTVPARAHACVAYDAGRGRVVLFGGRYVVGGGHKIAFGDTWEWDGSDWRRGAVGPAPRSSCMMTYDAPRDRIMLYGGMIRPDENTSNVTDETWVYE